MLGKEGSDCEALVHGAHSLFNTIIEDFLLFCLHGKDAVKCEAISLWTGAKVSRTERDGLEVVCKGNDDLAA